MAIKKNSGRIRISIIMLGLFVVLLPLVTTVKAGPVYKSVDSEGKITYSSIPPKDATQTKRMNIPRNEVATGGSSDNSNLEEIKSLAGEMEKDRLQREDDREAAKNKRDEALAKKQEEAAKKLAEKKAAEPVRDRYYPIYIPRRAPSGLPTPRQLPQ